MIDKEHEDHLAKVTDETVADLVEGANFIVACPVCRAGALTPGVPSGPRPQSDVTGEDCHQW